MENDDDFHLEALKVRLTHISRVNSNMKGKKDSSKVLHAFILAGRAHVGFRVCRLNPLSKFRRHRCLCLLVSRWPSTLKWTNLPFLIRIFRIDAPAVLMRNQWSALMYDTSFKCPTKLCRCTCLCLRFLWSNFHRKLSLIWILIESMKSTKEQEPVTPVAIRLRRLAKMKFLASDSNGNLWIKRPRLWAFFQSFFLPTGRKKQQKNSKIEFFHNLQSDLRAVLW